MSSTYRTRYLSVKHPKARELDGLPSAGPYPSITGMKRRFWGLDALCVRCGNYVYNVTSRPDIYRAAH